MNKTNKLWFSIPFLLAACGGEVERNVDANGEVWPLINDDECLTVWPTRPGDDGVPEVTGQCYLLDADQQWVSVDGPVYVKTVQCDDNPFICNLKLP